MNKEIIEILICPGCNTSLDLTDEQILDGEIYSGRLICGKCKSSYDIKNGIPILVIPELNEVRKKSWLGEPEPGKLKSRLWFITSNLIGLLFSPILAIMGWSMDLSMKISGWKPTFSIADIRGLLLWHLRHKRPYQHLRMLEHALAIGMIRDVVRPESAEYLIDIGAEKSLFCSYLAKLGYRTIALDLDESQMRWQKSLYSKYKHRIKKHMDFIVGSGTGVPFGDNCAHICAISVIEHIKDDKKAFSEIGRVIGNDHSAIISFLYQETPLSPGQSEAAWKRAREYHPAYGVPRDIDEFILTPSHCAIDKEIHFWKIFCRRTKKIVRAMKIFEHSILFDYFIYVRLARIEEARYPGKKANLFEGKNHPFQWVFRLKRRNKALT